MSELPRATATAWRRSTRCVGDHHCVEVAELDGAVGMRNSRRPEVSLIFSKPAWQGLIDAVKTGELD
jgi:hypothetical protein